MQRIKATPPQQLAVSTLTRMEIDYGLALNPQRAKLLAPMLDAFFSAVITLAFEQVDAKASAAIRAVLKTRGTPIGPYDVLIADSCMARGLTLITANMGEFVRVDALQVENWRNATIHP